MRQIVRLWAVLLFCLSSMAVAQSTKHPITVEDVLAMERIDHASFSPDGEWAAVVIRRSASEGEVYDRTAIEVDLGRSDVWLVSAKTDERQQITHGKPMAAGYWCATWSPDGRRLALLSTQPEGSEPRGGNNVRLYVWERASRRLIRQGDTAIMTQTRYGSPLTMPDLRGGADRGTLPHACGREENAPFLCSTMSISWLLCCRPGACPGCLTNMAVHGATLRAMPSDCTPVASLPPSPSAVGPHQHLATPPSTRSCASSMSQRDKGVMSRPFPPSRCSGR